MTAFIPMTRPSRRCFGTVEDVGRLVAKNVRSPFFYHKTYAGVSGGNVVRAWGARRARSELGQGVTEVDATAGEEWVSTTNLHGWGGLPVGLDEPLRWRLLRRIYMCWF